MLQEKPKNDDEKPKGRPRRPMILVALAMMAIGGIGVLWNDYKSSTTPPLPTPFYMEQTTTSYTVQTTSNTTTTTTRSTTTTSMTFSSGARSSNQFLSLDDLMKVVQQALKDIELPTAVVSTDSAE